MKMAKLVSMVMMLALCFSVTTVQASVSNHDGPISLFNPWNQSSVAVTKTLDRALIRNTAAAQTPHAGAMDGLSSWTVFSGYDFGKSEDKRAGGFDNYFNSYTIGADAFYNTTLVGLMVNYDDQQGSNGNGGRDNIDTWTVTAYMSQPVNEWLYWGGSFSFSNSDEKIRGNNGHTSSDSYTLSPYLMAVKQVDKWTFSLSPAYILGYQDVDYPNPKAPISGDKALMGKMLVMGRASYAVSDKMDISGDLNFNQVLHSHGLDTENDPDHNWFTTGVTLSYRFTDNLDGSVGYSTEFDSDYDSDIWNFGLNYAF